MPAENTTMSSASSVPSPSFNARTAPPFVSTARVSIDQNTSEPYVSVEFNAAGGKAFGGVH